MSQVPLEPTRAVCERHGFAEPCTHCEDVASLRAELAELRARPPQPDFSRMTLGDLEALAERYGKAVATIKEAQALFGGPTSAMVFRNGNDRTVGAISVAAPAPPAEPYPCPDCHRAGPITPEEQKRMENTATVDCRTCGNPKPFTAGNGGVKTNKGVVGLSAEEIQRRRQLMEQPAFGPDGEPV